MKKPKYKSGDSVWYYDPTTNTVASNIVYQVIIKRSGDVDYHLFGDHYVYTECQLLSSFEEASAMWNKVNRY